MAIGQEASLHLESSTRSGDLCRPSAAARMSGQPTGQTSRWRSQDLPLFPPKPLNRNFTAASYFVLSSYVILLRPRCCASASYASHASREPSREPRSSRLSSPPTKSSQKAVWEQVTWHLALRSTLLVETGKCKCKINPKRLLASNTSQALHEAASERPNWGKRAVSAKLKPRRFMVGWAGSVIFLRSVRRADGL